MTEAQSLTANNNSLIASNLFSEIVEPKIEYSDSVAIDAICCIDEEVAHRIETKTIKKLNINPNDISLICRLEDSTRIVWEDSNDAYIYCVYFNEDGQIRKEFYTNSIM